MGEFDVKYGAYERAMQQNNYFGLKGEQIGDQLGRYTEGLQHDQKKLANKAFGKEFARELSIERKALSAREQATLTETLSGTNKPASVTNVTTEQATSAKLEQKAPDKIKVKQKLKVGTAKTGFKFYIVDKQGNTYQVNRKTYNSAKKGKIAQIKNATIVDTNSPKIARKVRKASGKAPKSQIKLTTDPQAYHNQQQAMYEKLFNTPESRIIEAQGDIRRLEGQLANNTDKLANIEQAVANNTHRIANVEQAVVKNTQTIGNMQKTLASQGDDIANLTKKLAKTNKKLAFVAGIATLAAGAVGYLIGKSTAEKDSPKEGNSATVIEKEGSNNVNPPKNESNEQVNQTTTKDTESNNLVNNELATQVAKQETAENIPTSDVNVSLKEQVDTTTVVAQAKAEEKADSTSTVAQSSAVDINGKYVAKKGDHFWKIAEKQLKEKYKNEPEKFEKLPQIQKEIMLQLEAEKIMKQNKYKYDKNHKFSDPMLHPNDTLNITEKSLNQVA